MTGTIRDIMISQCGSKDILYLRTWQEVPSSNQGKMRRKEKTSFVHLVHITIFVVFWLFFKL